MQGWSTCRVDQTEGLQKGGSTCIGEQTAGLYIWVNRLSCWSCLLICLPLLLVACAIQRCIKSSPLPVARASNYCIEDMALMKCASIATISHKFGPLKHPVCSRGVCRCAVGVRYGYCLILVYLERLQDLQRTSSTHLFQLDEGRHRGY